LSLYSEAKAKIDFANNAIQKVSSEYNDVYSDAQSFAKEIYANRMAQQPNGSKPNVAQKV
jgi:hypothetical protein